MGLIIICKQTADIYFNLFFFFSIFRCCHSRTQNSNGWSWWFFFGYILKKYKIDSWWLEIFAKSYHEIGLWAIQNGQRSFAWTWKFIRHCAPFIISIAYYVACLQVSETKVIIHTYSNFLCTTTYIIMWISFV